MAIAIEEIGQSVRDVFRIEIACFGIAEDGAGEVAGRDDDETAQSAVEGIKRWMAFFGNAGIDPFQLRVILEVGLDKLRAKGLGAFHVDRSTKQWHRSHQQNGEQTVKSVVFHFNLFFELFFYPFSCLNESR